MRRHMGPGHLANRHDSIEHIMKTIIALRELIIKRS